MKFLILLCLCLMVVHVQSRLGASRSSRQRSWRRVKQNDYYRNKYNALLAKYNAYRNKYNLAKYNAYRNKYNQCAARLRQARRPSVGDSKVRQKLDQEQLAQLNQHFASDPHYQALRQRMGLDSGNRRNLVEFEFDIDDLIQELNEYKMENEELRRQLAQHN